MIIIDGLTNQQAQDAILRYTITEGRKARRGDSLLDAARDALLKEIHQMATNADLIPIGSALNIAYACGFNHRTGQAWYDAINQAHRELRAFLKGLENAGVAVNPLTVTASL